MQEILSAQALTIKMKISKKLKMLPSTMRERKRYLLLKTDEAKVEKAILRFVGELGYAKANPQFINKGGYLILSISHLMLDEVRASLSLSNIKVFGVSGTIEALMEKFGK